MYLTRMNACKVRGAAYKALACYDPAHLDSADLLRPLHEHGMLLVKETDGSAMQECCKLIKPILQHEYANRRR